MKGGDECENQETFKADLKIFTIFYDFFLRIRVLF